MRLRHTREKNKQPGAFAHVVPAHQLTRDRDEFFAQIDDESLDHFEDVSKLLQS
ncbi:hypothetical protein ABZ318_24295 [Streptomyces sp. NPDC006197]|uniref:hypothetical protein n=1 Tax=Streptomyces sp. NPDC006197 TaxID=3156685 RepID=UPI0033A52F42